MGKYISDFLGSLIPIILVPLPLVLIIISLLNNWWITAGIVAGISLLFWLGFFALIALCQRDHYSMDFIVTLRKIILFFLMRGWKMEDYFGAGSSNPGVIMSKPGCENVKIIMHSPLLFGRSYIMVLEDVSDVQKKWKFNESNYCDEVEIDIILSPNFGPVTLSEDDPAIYNTPFYKLYIRRRKGQSESPAHN